MKSYDAIIIGAGQAGVPLARRLASAHWKVLIIERDQVGGSCINYGCTPTKAMVASAKNAFQARRAAEYGLRIDRVDVDMEQIMSRKDQIVLRSRHGTEKSLKLPNLDLIRGEASFSDSKTVMVTGKNNSQKEFKGNYIFINTGTTAAVPKIEGIEMVPYLTSSSILELREIPKHLIIIGASYIALEFGQMFRRFGSEVSILAQEPRFLPKEDQDVADEVMRILKSEGIQIYTNAASSSIKQAEDGTLTLTATVNNRNKLLHGTHILLAAGRIPNTKALNLSAAGVKTDERGYIPVNSKLVTNVPHIYALGDVKGGPAFTHISYNDYLVVCKNLLDGKNASTRNRPVPYCMFIDPELARVGLNEDQAKEQGLNYKVAKLPMKHVARGIETGETNGFMKAVVDAKTKKILGVTILGSQGGEIMSLLQIAMQGGLTYEQLRETIFAHPTLSESINNLFMTLDDE